MLSASSLQNPPCLGHPSGAAPRLGRRCWEGAGEGDVSSPSSLCVLSPSSASSWDLQKFSSLHSLLGHLGFGQLMALTRSLQQGQSCRSRRPRNSCKDRKGSPGAPNGERQEAKAPSASLIPALAPSEEAHLTFMRAAETKQTKPAGLVSASGQSTCLFPLSLLSLPLTALPGTRLCAAPQPLGGNEPVDWGGRAFFRGFSFSSRPSRYPLSLREAEGRLEKKGEVLEVP